MPDINEISDQVRALVAAEPHLTLDLLGAVEQAIRSAPKPRIAFQKDNLAGVVILFGGVMYEIGCLNVVDTSQRWVSIDDSEVDTTKMKISPLYDQTEDYEGLCYFLKTGRGMVAVDLPEGWEER